MKTTQTSLNRHVMRPELDGEAALWEGLESIARRGMWILVAAVSAGDIAVTVDRHHGLSAGLTGQLF